MGPREVIALQGGDGRGAGEIDRRGLGGEFLVLDLKAGLEGIGGGLGGFWCRWLSLGALLGMSWILNERRAGTDSADRNHLQDAPPQGRRTARGAQGHGKPHGLKLSRQIIYHCLTPSRRSAVRLFWSLLSICTARR
jgi:hypothetical protein